MAPSFFVAIRFLKNTRQAIAKRNGIVYNRTTVRRRVDIKRIKDGER